MVRVLLCVGLMWLMAGQAVAVCVSMSLANLNTTQSFVGSGGGGYSVFDATTYPKTVTFDVKADVTLVNCYYFVVLRAGQSGDGNNRYLNLSGTHLPYNVYIDGTYANTLLPATSGNVANAIVGVFGTGASQTQGKSFVWKIPPQTIVPASLTNYTDSGVVLELWEGVLGILPVLRDSASINFQAKVETSVDISVVNTGAAFSLATTSRAVNYATATTGAQRNFDFSVRSNSGYKITLQSANGQKLKQSGVTPTIPYTITVNSVAQNLSSTLPVQVAAQTGGTTSLTGTNIPVRVTLGTITGTETSGSYQDNLSLAVSAN